VQILVEESLRLEREAKKGNFPMLADLTKPELPETQAAEVPASTLVLNNGQTVGGNGTNSTISAIDLINNSSSPNLLTGDALPTNIWIQVGAFSSKNNAVAVMGRVSDIADGEISSFDNGINVLHRVRLGPISSVEEADHILMSVIEKGYQGSKIILE
jgi:rare lipoprotein A